MAMPVQKPHRSKQDYQTPPELLEAIKFRLCIEDFDIDVAASKENAIAPYYLSLEEGRDALINSWQVPEPTNGWAWCNPPYSDIAPWIDKAAYEARKGAYVAMLIPASVGSNWWALASSFCYQLFLSPRITFVGCDTPYPKDCALLIFTPMGLTGNQVWRWK